MAAARRIAPAGGVDSILSDDGDGAATWFKWSAAVSVATFLALGIGGGYMGLDPESGLSITLALGWMVSTFVAVVSGVIVIFIWAGEKDCLNGSRQAGHWTPPVKLRGTS